jgi:hypothetical protein
MGKKYGQRKTPMCFPAIKSTLGISEVKKKAKSNLKKMRIACFCHHRIIFRAHV